MDSSVAAMLLKLEGSHGKFDEISGLGRAEGACSTWTPGQNPEIGVLGVGFHASGGLVCLRLVCIEWDMFAEERRLQQAISGRREERRNSAHSA